MRCRANRVRVADLQKEPAQFPPTHRTMLTISANRTRYTRKPGPRPHFFELSSALQYLNFKCKFACDVPSNVGSLPPGERECARSSERGEERTWVSGLASGPAKPSHLSALRSLDGPHAALHRVNPAGLDFLHENHLDVRKSQLHRTLQGGGASLKICGFSHL